MTYFEFKELARIVKERHPVWFGLESDPLASDADITRAEADLRVSLPAEYRAFVKDFGGGYFAFVNVFSVQPESEWNIVRRNRRSAIDRFIAISDNGVGDLAGFRVSGDTCLPEIVLWDHEEHGCLKPTPFPNLLEFLAKKGLKQ